LAIVGILHITRYEPLQEKEVRFSRKTFPSTYYGSDGCILLLCSNLVTGGGKGSAVYRQFRFFVELDCRHAGLLLYYGIIPQDSSDGGPNQAGDNWVIYTADGEMLKQKARYKLLWGTNKSLIFNLCFGRISSSSSTIMMTVGRFPSLLVELLGGGDDGTHKMLA
jgi:hypothetical protein